MNYEAHEYQLLTERQHRALMNETRREIELRRRLAHDPIAQMMQTLRCDVCGCPVTSCTCSDEMLPFCDPREVQE